MTPSAPQNIGVGDIVSTPGFWNKLASDNNDAPIHLRQENFLRGFIHEMKEAGASPFAVVGFMEEMSKLAVDYAIDPATGVATITSAAPAAPASRSSFLTPSGGWWDKTQEWLASKGVLDADPNRSAKVINAAATETSPTGAAIGGAIFNDPKQRAAFFTHWHNGDYGKAVSMAGNHIGSSDAVKRWAPVVAPALASVAAGRLSGLGWGGSLALGAGGALLGNEAHARGGWGNLSNDALGTSFPGGPRPTPSSAPPGARLSGEVAGGLPNTPNATKVVTPEGDAVAKQTPAVPGTATAAAQGIMKDNGEKADKIRIYNNNSDTQF